MTNFRTKLFGLIGLTTVFAGLSYGQIGCGTAGTPAPSSISPTFPILVRAEGETELVSDVVIGTAATPCSNSGAVAANGQLTAFLSLPVTSKAVAGLPAGNSEAALGVTPIVAGAPGATVFYQGTASGTTVSFANVIFPTNFTLELFNIRVNATGAGVTSAPVAVTESIFAGSNGLATVTYSGITVGQALKSLVAPAFFAQTAPQATVNNYVVCTGNTVGATAPAASFLSFTVTAAETFGGFFKTKTGGGVVQNGEQGSYIPSAGGAIGTAASGTNIALTLGNVPSVSTVYVPLSITYTPTGGVPATLTLTTSTTAATSPTGLTLVTYPNLGAYTFGAVAGITPSGGTVTVNYEVTASNAAQVETFQIPVFVQFAANAATAQGPITVLESYAPTATLTGLASSVPTFAPPTNTPLNASAITLCSTSILFPFITNQIGFDTGIAIANTSLDALGAAGASRGVAQSGTCTVSFYGSGAPTPNSITTPAISTIAGAGFAPTYAFQLSSVAPGFQGYAIASCNFQYGHAFVFLTTAGSAGNAAVAQGYLGLIMNNGANLARGASPAEQLTQ